MVTPLNVWLVREKAKELWEWLHNLEAVKYDHCEQLKRQRYEVSEERRGFFLSNRWNTFFLIFRESESSWMCRWDLCLCLSGDLSQKPHRWAAETVSKRKHWGENLSELPTDFYSVWLQSSKTIHDGIVLFFYFSLCQWLLFNVLCMSLIYHVNPFFQNGNKKRQVLMLVILLHISVLYSSLSGH